MYEGHLYYLSNILIPCPTSIAVSIRKVIIECISSTVECVCSLTIHIYCILYLCGGLCISSSGLPTCYPPGQRARVPSSKLSWFWFLGGYKLHQLDKQPLRQLLLPTWTQGLLPLWYHSTWKVVYTRVTT